MDWRAVRRSSAWTQPCWSKEKTAFVPAQNRFCAISFSSYGLCCLLSVGAALLHFRSRLAGPAVWCVVIFASSVAVDYAQLSVISLWLWNWQSSWWCRLYLTGMTASCFVLFCQVPTSSRGCCRCWTSCSEALVTAYPPWTVPLTCRFCSYVRRFCKIFFAFLLVSFDLSCGQVPFPPFSAIITHTPPPPLVGKNSVLAAHTYIHTYTHIHTYIDTYHLFTHHLSSSHTIFHILFDPSPPPLSFLPSR